MLPDRTVERVLGTCLGLRRGERVVLLVDPGSAPDVVAGLRDGITARGALVEVVELPLFDLPGSQLPEAAAERLLAADAAIELTSTFLGSSTARQRATAAGGRYLSMPAVVADTFRLGGPYDVDFDALALTTHAVSAAWEAASTFRLTSPAGTDLTGSVAGRHGRALTGVARAPGQYMAPPDIESGTAPVEGTANGVVVIDGDFLFMGPGPVREPVVLTIRDGRLVSVEGDEGHRLTEVMDRCADPRMANLAEVSVGLNPAGTVCGVPMETESTLGSAHIALGNSIAYGGTVAAPAHLDCVLQHATLVLDDRPVLVDGDLVGTAAGRGARR